MKKTYTSFLLAVGTVLVLVGCETGITEEQASIIVEEERSREIGEVKITTVEQEGREYIVSWENEENCESGTEYLDVKSGVIKRSEISIC